MIVAITATQNQISGPGEAEQIIIVDTNTGTEVERYTNPALTATSARGIVMLRSAIDRNAEALVVSGIGQHAMDYARGRIRILNGSGYNFTEAVEKIKLGQLHELHEANHMGHHH